METLGRKSVKFGETLTSNVDGNPELSLEWPGKCRDLTADKSERHLEEKVHTLGKPMDKLVITLVAFLAIFPTVITSVQAVTGITDIGKKRKVLPSLVEILGRKILKFGETLAARAVGNPELSLERPGKCRDLTGIKSERYLEEKVHSDMKILGKNDKLPSSSFDSKPYPISGGNWWNIGSWINRFRCSKKRNGQLSLFRIDMKGAVNA